MDNTQQTTQPVQSATDNQQPAADNMSTLRDVAGMTPPAPFMPPVDAVNSFVGMAPIQPAPMAPVAPMAPMAPVAPVMQSYAPVAPVAPDVTTEEKQPEMQSTVSAAEKDDYSYAEDVLNEILDSLDRIEAKLEAMEKKQG